MKNMRYTFQGEFFRCHDAFDYDFSSPLIAFTGPNGIGKTSLLEGLSLFSPGRGLRGKSSSCFQKQGAKDPWRLRLNFHGLELETQGCDNRRKIFANGVSLKTQTALSQWLTLIWPVDHWQDGTSSRRSYLNRLVFTLIPSYADLVVAYEKALYQRNLLLVQGEADTLWYESLEAILAQKGVEIFYQRHHVLDHLAKEMQDHATAFAIPHLRMEGGCEDLLIKMPAQEAYSQALGEGRALDRLKKTTSFGVHKTRFLLMHPNGREFSFCSTGEQKSLVLSVALAILRISQRQRCDHIHFLLLDEAMAHLDEQNQKWLWKELSALKAFVWITGPRNMDLPTYVHQIIL